MKTLKIKITEVDCYRGNAWGIEKYASHPAIQHQIVLEDGENELYVGFRIGPSDAGRGERIVFEKETTEQVRSLFLEAVEIKKSMKSEYCDTIEEYNEARAYNEPIKQELLKKSQEIHNLESLDISLEQFSKCLIWG